MSHVIKLTSYIFYYNSSFILTQSYHILPHSYYSLLHFTTELTYFVFVYFITKYGVINAIMKWWYIVTNPYPIQFSSILPRIWTVLRLVVHYYTPLYVVFPCWWLNTVTIKMIATIAYLQKYEQSFFSTTLRNRRVVQRIQSSNITIWSSTSD